MILRSNLNSFRPLYLPGWAETTHGRLFASATKSRVLHDTKGSMDTNVSLFLSVNSGVMALVMKPG